MKNKESLKTVKNYAKMQGFTTVYIYKLIKENKIVPEVVDGVYFIDLVKYPTIKG